MTENLQSLKYAFLDNIETNKQNDDVYDFDFGKKQILFFTLLPFQVFKIERSIWLVWNE